jgi:hypothetical protein
MFGAGFFTAMFYLGNLLFAVSYAVRDILSLRVLSVAAGLAATPYFIFREEPLWSAVLWQAVYMSINGVHIVLLMLDRRQVEMSALQERIHRSVFPSLRARQFVRLMDRAELRTMQPGEVLVEHSTDVEALMLVMSGEFHVEIDGQQVATLGSAHFVGELSLVRASTARGTVRTGGREALVACWSRSAVRRLERKQPELERALRDAIGRDMANKLAGA